MAQGHYVRWRSVENLIEELEVIKAQYGMRFVRFHDDIFMFNKDWFEEFCEHYRQKIGLPFICNARANLVTDSMSQMLTNAGCIHVFLGLESGNDHIRNVVLNRNHSREQIINACCSLQAHGITITTYNMYGLPFETIDTVLDTIELNITCRPQQASIFFYVPYPRTRLAQVAEDEGMLQAEDIDSLPEIFTSNMSSVNLNLENVHQIEQLAKLTTFCLHFPTFYPVIRFLFKRQGGNWIKAILSQGLLFLQEVYVHITGGSVNFPRHR